MKCQTRPPFMTLTSALYMHHSYNGLIYVKLYAAFVALAVLNRVLCFVGKQVL